MKNKFLYGIVILLVFLASDFQQLIAKNHVTFTVKNPKVVLTAEKPTADVVVTAKVEKPWYFYGIVPRVTADGIGPQATEISVFPKKIIELAGKVIPSKPKVKFDKGFEINIDYYNDKASFTIPIRAAKGVKKGTYKAYVNFFFQVCDTVRCLPGIDDSVAITVELQNDNINSSMSSEDVSNSAANTSPENKVTDASTGNQPTIAEGSKEKVAQASEKAILSDSQREIESKKKEGIWAFLKYAMLAGATALLTPCVFPMIPITVSFFTKRAEKSSGNALRDSSMYALGIIFTFTALGFILSTLLGATGITDFAANPWVNIAIATIFITLALNLFGAFEIQIPTSILNALNTKSNEGSGIGSVLLMGLTFSLTSFTCTVPFVGAALVSASGGEWFYPIIGMLGFSSVFAAPFFLFALFPTALKSLPKAGGWMNNIKVVMGFLEVAAALKFLSNADLVWRWGILSREVFLAAWVACSILAVMYVLGKFSMKLDTPVKSIGGLRITFAIIFATISVVLFGGMMGQPLGELDAFVPPANYREMMGSASAASVLPSTKSTGNKTSSSSHEGWIKNYEEGLKIAKETGKPVFVDFTGFTCTNCRWMEANVFSKPDIAEVMNSMVKVQLYTDRKEEPFISNQKLMLSKFNTIELPFYVVLSPDGTVQATKAYTRDKQEFLDFLKKGFITTN